MEVAFGFPGPSVTVYVAEDNSPSSFSSALITAVRGES